ncbi:MAG: hypothetical protein CMI08_13960 [Oceanospirillaceae bacterium]|uniref:hypothetical protein n=1 Tax=unclassified Thalassolituus TaxID=2624967 RepID=UPI000C3F74F1|nr:MULTISPECIES: hypothetical protein [unclassified Thalassolituus]MAS24103.1 hypothetical protein [Oceanospirillaceae bacterium]MAY00273.1 hypothetical protein [Oceanospirillaceae bacterium]MBL35153.1 hypothetical protein [Oceanospirillaceae bacterium]MBS51358.1 hypothetical protein [Oceanospirillaceae bacterium]|tara:strand:- start:2419 stop:2880 length:462 start_codon:yes stop_codon:yes gene_type:complete
MRTLLLALLMVPGLVMAEVSLKTEAFKIVAVPQTDGSVMEEWRSADQVVPGDKVGYRISYNNTGSDAAEAVVINNPVPAQSEFIANSAIGAGSDVTYSVDGGNSFAAASQLTVEENGATREAKASDYTNIRWQLTQPVAAGASGQVEFKVRIK